MIPVKSRSLFCAAKITDNTGKPREEFHINCGVNPLPPEPYNSRCNVFKKQEGRRCSDGKDIFIFYNIQYPEYLGIIIEDKKKSSASGKISRAFIRAGYIITVVPISDGLMKSIFLIPISPARENNLCTR